MHEDKEMLATNLWYVGVSVICLVFIPIVYWKARREDSAERKRLLSMCKEGAMHSEVTTRSIASGLAAQARGVLITPLG